jgi:hypothetical protein
MADSATMPLFRESKEASGGSRMPEIPVLAVPVVPPDHLDSGGVPKSLPRGPEETRLRAAEGLR